MKLDKRLEMLYEMIQNGSRIADIGTDHGYLIAKLIQDNKCPYAIGVDINRKPLSCAERLVNSLNLNNQIDLRLSNGLDNVSADEVDDIVIAGMGSDLILDIILKHKWTKQISDKYFILQPMTKPWVLRENLYLNGFQIVDEKVVKCKKFFYIGMGVIFTGKREHINSASKYIGKIGDLNNEISNTYLSNLLTKLKYKVSNLIKYEEKSDKITELMEVVSAIQDKIITTR